ADTAQPRGFAGLSLDGRSPWGEEVEYSADAAESPLQRDRRLFGAHPLRPVPAAREGPRERAGGGWLRARLQPRLELRPLGDRASAVAEALSALHGEIGALLVALDLPAERRRRLSGASRPARHRRDRNGGAPRPRGQRRGDVPRGDAADEGPREGIRGAAALGPRAG